MYLTSPGSYRDLVDGLVFVPAHQFLPVAPQFDARISQATRSRGRLELGRQMDDRGLFLVILSA